MFRKVFRTRSAWLFALLLCAPQGADTENSCKEDLFGGYPANFLSDSLPSDQRLRRQKLHRIQSCLHSNEDIYKAGADEFVRALGWDLLAAVIADDWLEKWQGPDTFLASSVLQALGAHPNASLRGTAQLDKLGYRYEMILMNQKAASKFKALLQSGPDQVRDGEPNLIDNFPQASRIVKGVWLRVPSGSYVRLGVWPSKYYLDPIGGAKLPMEKWKECVVVYRANQPPQDMNDCGEAKDRFVTVSSFVNIELTDENLKKYKFAAGNNSPNPELEPGDTMILVGLHLATKELADWTWSTFWWQPEWSRTDTPPALTPPEGKLSGQWKQFLGNTSISFSEPAQPLTQKPTGDGSYNVIFNPYLEGADLDDGTASNCMSCHSRASTSTSINPSQIRDFKLGLESAKDFEGATKTDYIWSLASLLK